MNFAPGTLVTLRGDRFATFLDWVETGGRNTGAWLRAGQLALIVAHDAGNFVEVITPDHTRPLLVETTHLIPVV